MRVRQSAGRVGWATFSGLPGDPIPGCRRARCPRSQSAGHLTFGYNSFYEKDPLASIDGFAAGGLW